MMYRRDESGDIRAYDRDWANNEWDERTYPVDKKDPCASDNSMSGSYESSTDDRIHSISDYSKNTPTGIKEVFNAIEIIGFDRSSMSLFWQDITYGNRVMPCGKFLKTYGKDLLKISEELSDKGIYLIPDDWGGRIILYKKKSGELNDEYRSAFYESLNEVRDKFPYDAVEMSKQGFTTRYFGAIIPDEEYIGHMVTFIKKIN